MDAPPPSLNLLVIRSRDIERAVHFYRQLGLVMAREVHGSGPEHYPSSVEGRVFEIYPLRAGAEPTTGERFGFAVDDVDALVPMLVEIGAVVIQAPADSARGRRAVVKDLDGHVVELVGR